MLTSVMSTSPCMTVPVSVEGSTAIRKMAVVSVMVVIVFIVVLVVLWLVAVTVINI